MWHDSDSVCIRRLRDDGMRVIEQARPRIVNDMSTNHGGVGVAVSESARLQPVNTGSRRATFEHVSCQITSRQSSCVVLLVYRPESDPICSAFFDELSDVLLHLTVLDVSMIVAGDINIHLERQDESHSRRFTELLASAGLQSRVQTATTMVAGLT